MAEKTWYAWSRILVHDGTKQTTIMPGKEVTMESLHTDKDHWRELIEGGAIRSTPWPEDLDPKNPNAQSPNVHRLMKLRKEREALEAEMAGVGGSAHVLSNTEESATDDDAGISEDDYELDERGELKLDAAGNPIRKQAAA